MLLVDDKNGHTIQGFAPNKGVTYSGTVTVQKVTGAKLGIDVSITIDSKTVSYIAGEGIILIPGVSYTFSSSVDCHVME